MSEPVYLLFEVANAHDGDYSRVLAMIDAAGAIEYPRRGIKFHPIAADALALPDFPYYENYRKFEFSMDQWASIIDLALAKVGNVWLEMADVNCVNVLKANLDKVSGVKFQASMVENYETISLLRDVDVGRIDAIVNISGYELENIPAVLDRIGKIGFRELILQAGYQDYPTDPENLYLNKIAILKREYPEYRLSFADHVDGADPFAGVLPVAAAALGCDLVEKHFCLSRAATQYDKFSSFEPQELSVLKDNLLKLAASLSENFIGDRERVYLADGIIKPLTSRDLAAGSLVGSKDVIFRRSSQQGLTFNEIVKLQSDGFVLAAELAPRTAITRTSFRSAKVGSIVAARLKSTRLPNKATLKLAGVPSIERCLQSCLANSAVDTVILASSTHPQDADLAHYNLGGRVPFRRGDPDDVIKRYVDVADEFGIDVIVRVTGDCPIVSAEATNFLVREHFARGADLTRARRETIGATPQIISTTALKKVIQLIGSAPYSEYMNQYFENNPDIFKVEVIDIPPEYIRDYRLTLDVAEDFEMFTALYTELNKRNLSCDYADAIKVLDERPDIAALNGSIKAKYHVDQELIDLLKRETRIVL